MPIFMDRHVIPGVSAKDVAKAHSEDLNIQEQYDCKGLTYWFDEKRGLAFCLIEAPNEKAVSRMHKKAHGLVPNQIMEVKSNVVEAFLGRMKDPEVSPASSIKELPINESAFRSVMYLNRKFSYNISSEYFDPATKLVSQIPQSIYENSIVKYDGSQVPDESEGLMFSFSNTARCVDCAIEILAKLQEYNIKFPRSTIFASIGISAGDPVTESKDLFGKAVNSAKRLFNIAAPDKVLMASTFLKHSHAFRKFISYNTRNVKVLSTDEDKFLENLMNVITRIWNYDNLSVEKFSKEIGLSKTQLYRKLISVNGQSPNEFIKNYCLLKSKEMIEQDFGNISEIAFETGFSSSSYFSKRFLKRFGVLPSVYAASLI